MRTMFRSTLAVIFSIIAINSSASAQDAQTRLWDAAKSGDTAAIRLAVKEGAKLDSIDFRSNRSGRLALNWAAWNDKVDAIKVLLELKAPINAMNATSNTPLHHAAENGSMAAAKALLEAGADPTLLNQGQMTPFDVAQAKGFVEIEKLLKDALAKAKK